ncbi:Hemin import ATP-binding protein HmuV [Pseudooceanicola marinus]|uniref:Hemin import ATP-binding protein HmuV n=1 Tax=Pseudooceanicola marinus TaxID=396013 RepID=A0A1X6Z3N3_9RHOB|nr:heme ABC transporter ATP-binding protein [Pseudooceanicola marinus]PJE32325.1 heme ABC transporter ATP-binding protein [Pseudooceanicola marinus]SLN39525.1 Hemin import ATP-binding protein HmuV [Pseudooceanicola marinus]
MTLSASLSATDITLRLRRTTILDQVDFAAEPGEVTAIVGPNGSGKTTLLRVLTGEIAGQIAPGGQVRMGGLDVVDADPWVLARRRAVLAQQTALSFPFTVLEVVRLGAEGPGGAARALAALARVDLAHYGGRLYQELSGGEQQRVQLARVLAQLEEPVGPHGPRWLFLDEPVSALDIAHQLQVMEIAADFARRGGGVIAVMHDLNLTAMYARKVVLLQQGRCIGAGPTEEVLTDDLLSRAYGCDLRMGVAPGSGLFLLPQSAQIAHESSDLELRS